MKRRPSVFTFLFLAAAVCGGAGCAVHSARSYRFLHFLSFLTAGPRPKAKCGEREGMRYCIHRAPLRAKEDETSVLYFLHYAGGSQHSWEELPLSRVYYSYFRRRYLPAPRVVTVSYGPYWTLIDRPEGASETLFERFIEQDMPFLEEKLGGPRRRFVWGMSQGGLNAASLLLKRPELFSGGVLSCPAFYSVSIYADEEELRRYTERTNADFEGSVMWGVRRLRRHIGGPEVWAREDPLFLVRDAERAPPMLIQANRRDEFGFFEGAEQFYLALRRNNHTVDFKPSSGGHCVVGIGEAVRYLRWLRY